MTESSISNVVIEKKGAFFTPPIRCGLLPGTFRKKLLDEGIISEKVIKIDELLSSEGIYLINSVRRWQKVTIVRN